MLTLTIEITGKTYGDLHSALEVVTKQISEEYRAGFDSNDDGNYSYNVSGEEEESEEDGWGI